MLLFSRKSSPLNRAFGASGFKTLALAAAALSFSACASVGDRSSDSPSVLADGEFYTQDFPEVSENTLAINAEQDRFRVGDTADIFVYNVETLTNSYPVDREGNINFPLIGTQKVAGLTTLELQKQLMSAYGENYLQSPNITVKLEANTLGNIVVDGAVAKPGVFELYKPVRLSEAVALAGGLGEFANDKEIYIVREIEGKKAVKTVNLKDIRQMGATDHEIYPQDIIYVQKSPGKAAYNEFLKTIPLLSAILLAGTR